MTGDEPVTRRECAAVHVNLADSLKGIADKLDILNGSVAENSKFRLESKAIYKALAFGWATLMLPLAAIAVAVLK